MMLAQPALHSLQEMSAAKCLGNQPPPVTNKELSPQMPTAPATPMGRVLPATREHRCGTSPPSQLLHTRRAAQRLAPRKRASNGQSRQHAGAA